MPDIIQLCLKTLSGRFQRPSNILMAGVPNRALPCSIVVRSVVIHLVYILEMSQSVKDALIDAVNRLAQADISEPELSAKYLLQQALNLDGIEFQLALNNNIDESSIEMFNELLERRLTHEPVQYILGYVDFYNVRLKVDKRVLIPRPETEEMVDQLLKRVGDRKNLSILDIGTGSGNIAIALAASLDQPQITAIDISRDALILAQQNSRANNVDSKIKFTCDDIFNDKFWKGYSPFDIIVSNPPYVLDTDFDTLQPEIKLFEPRIALISENDVLGFYKEISKQAAKYLNRKGLLCFEIGFGQEFDVQRIIRENIPKSSIDILNDLTGKPRIVIVTV